MVWPPLPLHPHVWVLTLASRDIAARTATPMDVQTNPFCAAGASLPNGTFATFGGNSAVGPGGDNHTPGSSKAFDPTYQIYNGLQAIRLITPCEGDLSQPQCQWYDSANGLQMAKARWYPGVEQLADGSVVILGGFSSGGYINRNTPNTDPAYSGGGSEPTFEFYPSRGGNLAISQFMIKTSGLNSYAHMYLMPSGKMFVQANYSSMIWDYNANVETALPDMPNQIVRVYPASGATAMLPLTPANNYTPTVLFCGGSDMTDEQWGNFSFPNIDTWNHPASADCQRITPEPTDGSAPVYVQDDDMPVGRTMGQFIALPDGTLLVLNGGANGTAGYAQATGETSNFGDMPFGESLASAPVGQPAIYNPKAPAGQRWSTAGLGTSNIPRLYHSSAVLLPDGSVFVAGSNPNIDVNTSTVFPTTYTAEIFYPPYFSAKTRPAPSGVPTNLTYGGNPFDITIPSTSYSGNANDAADNTTVWLMRQGFTTHAMNMGQRAVALNSTYTVGSDGTITIHTAQPPPNPNLFQPGPGFVYVTVNGIPSNGTYVIVGSGQIGNQPTAPASVLPASVRAADNSSGSAPSNGTDNSNQSNGGSSNTGAIIGGVVAAIAAVGIL
ncbi:copper radical oxidase, partial [Auriscalpium vulgare]